MLTVPMHLQVRRPTPTTVEYTVSTAPPSTWSSQLLAILVHGIRIVLGLLTLAALHVRYLNSICDTVAEGASSSSSFSASALTSPAIANGPLAFLHTCNSRSLPPSLRRLYHDSPAFLRPLFALVVCADGGARIPLAVLVPAALLLLRLLLTRPTTTESLLVLRGLGIQTSGSARTYLGLPSLVPSFLLGGGGGGPSSSPSSSSSALSTTRFIPTGKIQDVYINEAFRGFGVVYYLVVVVHGERDLVVVFPRLLPGRRILEEVWRGARAGLWDTVGGVGSGAEGLGKASSSVGETRAAVVESEGKRAGDG